MTAEDGHTMRRDRGRWTARLRHAIGTHPSSTTALRIVLSYAVIAAAWVLFSDTVLTALVPDTATLGRLQTVKGGLFILATSGALYVLVRGGMRQLRASEASATEAGERLRFVLENMPAMLGAFDEQGTLLVWNRECERVTGYPAEELLGTDTWLATICPDDAYLATMMAEWEVRGNDYRDWEWRTITKDGRERVIAWSNLSDELKVPGWPTWGVGVDVTDRIAAASRVGRLNDLLRLVWEINRLILREKDRDRLLGEACRLLTAHAGFVMAWVGLADHATGRVRPVAVAGHEDGYLEQADVRCDDSVRSAGPAGTAIRTGLHYVIDDTDTNPRFAPWREAALGRGYRSSAAFPIVVHGMTVGAITVYACESGAFGPEEISLIEQLAGDLGLALQVIQDAEALDYAQERLRTSEERFRTLAEEASDALFRLRIVPDIAYEYVSPAMKSVLGWSPEELYEDPMRAVRGVPPATRAVFEAIQAGTADLSEPVVLEWPHRDGRVVWVEKTLRPVLDDDGRVVVLEGIARDVTERHYAELALEQEKARLLSIVEASPLAIMLLDGEARVADDNAASKGIFGCAECGGAPLAEMLFDLGADEFDVLLARALEGERVTGIECRRLHTPPAEGVPGRIVDLRLSLAALRPGDAAAGFVVVAEDVTAYKRAEVELRRAADIFDVIGVGIAVCDPIEGCFELVNPTFARMHGWGPGELLGMPIVDVFAPSQRDAVAARIHDTDLRGTLSFESVHARKDGSEFPVSIDVTIVHDDDGTMLYRIANVVDITDRRRMEDAAHESAERFEAVVESSPVSLFLLDERGFGILHNKAAKDTFG